MKKCFLFLPTILFSYFLFAVEGEGRVEKPAEKPVEYKEPENDEQAKKEWDQSEKDLKEAQDKEDEVKSRIGEMTQKLNRKEITYGEYLNFIDNELAPTVKKRTAIEEAQKKLSENKLVEQYKKDLEAAYTPPVQEPSEEPSWWKRLTQKANAWFKERQLDFYNWLGNKEKVIKIRTDLIEVYGDLGTSGLLNKARNRKQLSQAVEVLEKKISHGLDAFEEYKLALDKGNVTEKQKSAMKDEIRELSVDLLKLREELDAEDIDILNEEIDAVLEKFGIGKEERIELEKQGGIEPEKSEIPKTTAELQKASAEIRQQNVEEMTAVQRDAYIKKTLTLAEANLAALPPLGKAAVHATVERALDEANIAVTKEVLNPVTKVEDRVEALGQTREFTDQLNEASKKVEDELDKLIAEIEPLLKKVEGKTLPKDFSSSVEKELTALAQKYDITKPDSVKQYEDKLKEVELTIDDAPVVDAEKIKARRVVRDIQYIVTDKYLSEVEPLLTKEKLNIEKNVDQSVKEILQARRKVIEEEPEEAEFGQVVAEMFVDAAKASQQLYNDRVTLIDVDQQGNPKLKKAAPQQLSSEARTKQQKVIDILKKRRASGEIPSNSKEAFLSDILKGKELKPVELPKEPQQRSGLFSALEEAMKKKGILDKEATEQESSDEWGQEAPPG